MEFDRNDYSGEQQIIDTLTKRGKFIPTDQFDAQFDNIRLDAEEFLFDADAVQQSSLRRNAAVRSGLVLAAARRARSIDPHRRAARLLAREGGPCRQEMGAAHARHRPVRTISHRTPWSPAGSRSTSRRKTPTSSMCRRAARPIPKTAQKLDGRVYETAAPAAWFLGVDSKGVAATGDPCEWRAPIRVKPDVKRVSGGYKVSFAVLPRAATIRATFDGSDPEDWPPL